MIGRHITYSNGDGTLFPGVVWNISSDLEGSTVFLIESSTGDFYEIPATKCKVVEPTTGEFKIGDTVIFRDNEGRQVVGEVCSPEKNRLFKIRTDAGFECKRATFECKRVTP